MIGNPVFGRHRPSHRGGASESVNLIVHYRLGPAPLPEVTDIRCACKVLDAATASLTKDRDAVTCKPCLRALKSRPVRQ